MKDLVVCWPKSKPLEYHLNELRIAEQRGVPINFRVPHFPKGVDPHDPPPLRVYVVYADFIRGHNMLTGLKQFKEGELLDIITGEPWPAGLYLERDPEWHPFKPAPKPMKSFKGWRWYS